MYMTCDKRCVTTKKHEVALRPTGVGGRLPPPPSPSAVNKVNPMNSFPELQDTNRHITHHTHRISVSTCNARSRPIIILSLLTLLPGIRPFGDTCRQWAVIASWSLPFALDDPCVLFQLHTAPRTAWVPLLAHGRLRQRVSNPSEYF